MAREQILPEPAHTPPVDPGVLTLLGQVADGLRKIEALEARVKALEDKPVVQANHVHVPKESMRVEVAQPAAIVVPPSVVNLPERKPRSAHGAIERDGENRMTGFTIEESA